MIINIKYKSLLHSKFYECLCSGRQEYEISYYFSCLNILFMYSPDPTAQAERAIKLIFDWNINSLNSELSVSKTLYLKNPVYPTIYPQLEGEQLNAYLSQGH